MVARSMLALLLSGMVASIAVGQAPTASDAQMEALIRKLGSSVFVEREKARRDLDAIGIPALGALRRAQKPADPETQYRLTALIRKAEEQLLTNQVLAPKEVHLSLKDATVDEAIAELSKQGYPVQFQGDRTLIADKKITLDTGKTSFWQALDQVCERSSLIERMDGNTMADALQMLVPKLGKKGRFVPMNGGGTVAPGPIVLTNRGSEKVLTSYAGAVKSQLRVLRDANAKELVLQFTVSVEPRLLNSMLAGRPIIDRALDQDRRRLPEPTPAPPALAPNSTEGIRFAIDDPSAGMPGQSQRTVHVRIKETEHAVKQIRELAGKLSLQLDLANETVAKVEKVLDASGKSVDGANGGTLKVNSVRKIGDDIEVQVSMVNLTPNPFGNNIVINGGNVMIRGNINIQGGIIIGPNGVRVGGQNVNGSRPDLMDAKGEKFQVVSANSNGTSINNGTISTAVTIVYRANPGQAAPNDLVLFGTRTHTIAVPFRFEDVPLP